METNINPFKLVEKFNHELVGVPYRVFPHQLDKTEFFWLLRVLIEETTEFARAIKDSTFEENNVIDQVDALMDLIYFTMGGLTRLGVTAEQSLEIFKVIHECNCRKKAGNKGRGSDLDAIKPEDWEGPEPQITKILKGEKT